MQEAVLLNSGRGLIVALVAVLLIAAAGLLNGCAPMAAKGVSASGLIVPPDLATIYLQVSQETGVPLAALAAWDASQFELVLPVPTSDAIFQEFLRLEAERRKGKPLTPKEETALREQATTSRRSLVHAHVAGNARALQPYIAELSQTPAGAFSRVLSDLKAVRAAELFEEYQVLEMKDQANSQFASNLVAGGTFVWPADGEVSSRYGLRRSPIDGLARKHEGIDIAVNTGANIVAVRPGVVEEVRVDPVLGRMVIIDHGDGYQSVYAHNSRVLVKVGQVVSRREVIALAGESGVATGPHLHFEIRFQGSQVNPLLLLPDRQQAAP